MINRYHIATRFDLGRVEYIESPDIAGRWVKWKDVKTMATELDELKAECEALKSELTRLEKSLVKSVELQCHYAYLLNMSDGGRRLLFRNKEEWIARLIKIGELND